MSEDKITSIKEQQRLEINKLNKLVNDYKIKESELENKYKKKEEILKEKQEKINNKLNKRELRKIKIKKKKLIRILFKLN